MAANKKDFLDQRATQKGFAELVGISQPAVSGHVASGTLSKNGTFRTWLAEYVEHLRDQAAGRGGSQQESLATAKTEESKVKAALGRIQYQEKIGNLVPAEDAGRALEDWSGYANREYTAGLDKLVAEIEGAHDIKVDPETVKSIAESTTAGIAGYAEELGRGLVASVESLSAEAEGSDV